MQLECSMSVFLIISMRCIVSLGFVFMLPSQKAQAHALKNDGNPSKSMAAVVLVLLAVSLIISTIGNIFAIIPSKQCTLIAGGDGC